MNELVTVGAGTPIGYGHDDGGAKRALAIAKGLRQLRAELLEPTAQYWALYKRYPEWFQTTLFKWPDADEPFRLMRPPENAEIRDLMLENYREKLGTLPPAENDVIALLCRLRDQSQAPFDAKTARMIVGFLTGSYPNARPHDPITYTEAIIDAVRGDNVSPGALAQACDEIKRNEKFLPTVSEIMGAISMQRLRRGDRFFEGLMEGTINARCYLEDAIKALEVMTDLPEPEHGRREARQ